MESGRWCEESERRGDEAGGMCTAGLQRTYLRNKRPYRRPSRLLCRPQSHPCPDPKSVGLIGVEKIRGKGEIRKKGKKKKEKRREHKSRRKRPPSPMWYTRPLASPLSQGFSTFCNARNAVKCVSFCLQK